MFGGAVKGLGALALVWFTYIDKTFTPLFWVLMVLVGIDMVLHVGKEGQQFNKIGSMAVALGIPSVVGENLNNPLLGKYLVAIMCLVYLQLVVPALVQRIGKIKFSQDPKTNARDQADISALLQKVQALEAAQAKAVLDSTQLAGNVSNTQAQAQVSKDVNGGL